MPKNNKVVCICLDGGETTIIREFIKRGCMPQMEKILGEAPLMPLDGYVEGPGQGWGSFITGKSPVKHGIFYWTVAQGVDAGSIDNERIWDILGRHGVTCGVINMSYTFPPQPVNGFMVSGLGGGLVPNSQTNYFFPPELKDEVAANVGEYVSGVRRTRGSFRVQRQYLSNCIKVEEQRGKVSAYLCDRYDPDLLIHTIKCSDPIQHSFWNLLDPECRVGKKAGKTLTPLLEEMFRTIDKVIGDLWYKHSSAYRFIFSDHGFGRTKGIFYVNEWLASQGYLVKKNDARSKIGTYYFRLFREIIEPYYYRYRGLKIVQRVNTIRKAKMPPVHSAIDLDKSAMYARRAQGIFFNKAVVSSHDQEIRLFNEVKDRLAVLKMPGSDLPLIKSVYTKDAFGDLAHSEAAPDIVLEFADEGYIALHKLFNKKTPLILEPVGGRDVGYHNGSHRKYGILISSEPVEQKETAFKITDISATLLQLFDVPIAADMNGTPIL